MGNIKINLNNTGSMKNTIISSSPQQYKPNIEDNLIQTALKSSSNIHTKIEASVPIKEEDWDLIIYDGGDIDGES